MFVHVIFEHVRHDYAPIYTLDVESPRIAPNTVLHWEEQLWRLVFGRVGLVSISMICNLGNTTAAFKERALIGFYFYNCFDTDRKNDILSVLVILFFYNWSEK